MTDLIGLLQLSTRTGMRIRRGAAVQRRQSADLERWRDPVADQRSGGAVDPRCFAEILAADFDRLHHGGADRVVAVISLSEIAGIRGRLGDHRVFDLITEVTQVVSGVLSSSDFYDISEDGEIVILAGGRRATDATGRIEALCAAIADRRFGGRDERLRLTPLTGVTTLSRGKCPKDVLERARHANRTALLRAERRVQRLHPGLPAAPPPASSLTEPPTDGRAAWTLAKLSAIWERLPESFHERLCDTVDGSCVVPGELAVPVTTASPVSCEGHSSEVPLPRRLPGASLRRPRRDMASGDPNPAADDGAGGLAAPAIRPTTVQGSPSVLEPVRH